MTNRKKICFDRIEFDGCIDGDVYFYCQEEGDHYVHRYAGSKIDSEYKEGIYNLIKTKFTIEWIKTEMETE